MINQICANTQDITFSFTREIYQLINILYIMTLHTCKISKSVQTIYVQIFGANCITQSISGFHRASLLTVTFINQLMHSIITVVDVKILLYKSLKDTY